MKKELKANEKMARARMLAPAGEMLLIIKKN